MWNHRGYVLVTPRHPPNLSPGSRSLRHHVSCTCHGPKYAVSPHVQRPILPPCFRSRSLHTLHSLSRRGHLRFTVYENLTVMSIFRGCQTNVQQIVHASNAYRRAHEIHEATDMGIRSIASCRSRSRSPTLSWVVCCIIVAKIQIEYSWQETLYMWSWQPQSPHGKLR